MNTASRDTIFTLTTDLLGRLDAQRSVETFRDLLWAEARRCGVGVTKVRISLDVNVADGGIDASVDDDVPGEFFSELLTRGTRFQIKAGKNCGPWQPSYVRDELFGKRPEADRNSLRSAVRRCLNEHGRYVLVCFGVDPTVEQLRKATDNFTAAFDACGYKNPQVEVWGQTQLIGLLQRFPSLCLQLLGRDEFGFMSHKAWSMSEDMRPTHRPDEEHSRLVEEIRTCLRHDDIRHIRVLGEPGVGKTRLVLEATRTDDLAPLVVFVPDGDAFQRTPLFNALVRTDNHFFTILVIDECQPRDRASIWNVLKSRSDRVRLVTLDHGPDESADDQMRVIQMPPLQKEKLAEIIAEYVPSKHEASRWAEFCEGSPRVAHVVGQNLRQNPGDILKEPAAVDVWGRFIVGRDDPDSERVELRRIVLRHLALFERCGFESPVDEEAKWVAELARDVDDRLTWGRFQSIVTELRQRRIVQGRTTIFIAPRLLHVYLYREFWNHHGRGFDTVVRLPQIPDGLRHWFVAMLKYAHTSSIAESEISRLLGPAGLFGDDGLRSISGNGRLLMSLAQSNSRETLECLERTVGHWDGLQRLKITSGRQHVVWTLEYIAVWSDYFVRAANLMLHLAETENAQHQSNASRTFAGLFSLIPGWAATQAPPPRRLPVLQAALTSPNSATRMLGLKACVTALSRYDGFRIVGPEHQGLHPTIEFWYPETYGELWAAYEAVWDLLVAQLKTWTGEERAKLNKAIISASGGVLSIPTLTEAVVRTLEEIALDPVTDIAELVRVLRYSLRNLAKELSADIAERLRALDRRLDGHDFPSRLKRFVKFVTLDDEYDENHNRIDRVQTQIEELANEVISDPSLLEAELEWLICEPPARGGWFAFQISRLDPEVKLLGRLLHAQDRYGDRATSGFLSGYLGAIFERERASWEATVLALAERPAVRRIYARVVIQSGTTDAAVQQAIALCEQSAFGIEQFADWWFRPQLREINEPTFLRLVELHLNSASHDAWVNVVHLYDQYYCDKESTAVLPNELTLRVLTHPAIGEDQSLQNVSYYWAKIAAKFLECFPDRTWDLFKAALICGTEHWSGLVDLNTTEEQILSWVIRRDPERAWDCIAEAIADLYSPRACQIAHWLQDGYQRIIGDESPGLLPLIPPNVLWAWVDGDVDKRAYWLAGALPKMLDQSSAGRLTRDFVARYGDRDAVRSGLWANFHSRGWSGPASAHFRHLAMNRESGWTARLTPPSFHGSRSTSAASPTTFNARKSTKNGSCGASRDNKRDT